MRRGMSVAIAVALAVVLVVSLFGQLVVFPDAVARAASLFPEVELYAGLGIAWGVLSIACIQVIALCSIPLLLTARTRAAGQSPTIWHRVIQGATLLLLALIIAAIVALNTLAFATPGIMVALIVSGILVLAAFGVLVAQGTGRSGQHSPSRSRTTVIPSQR